MVPMQGGCLCGAVRYTLTADPILTGICHCRNCQKQTGSAFSVNVAVPAAAFSATGAMKTYEYKGGSGGAVSRHFCADRGSPILTEAAALPGVTIVRLHGEIIESIPTTLPAPGVMPGEGRVPTTYTREPKQ